MNRIIEVKVNGPYLTKDSSFAGVQGEANAAALRIEFDEAWEGFSKTITWWNARGSYGTSRLLTMDCLEDIAASGRIYLVPVPGEAMTVPGKCTFALDGYVDGKRQRSVYGSMLVKDNGSNEDDPTPEVTPTVAEQLQSELEYITENIRDAIASNDAAAQSEANAKASEDASARSAASAQTEANKAAAEAVRAEQIAAAHGWAEFNVVDGRVIYLRTDNVSVDFSLVDGRLVQVWQ